MAYNHQQHKAFGDIKQGALHQELGVSQKKKIPVSKIHKDLAAAKKRHDVHRERQDEFALNARKFNKK